MHCNQNSALWKFLWFFKPCNLFPVVIITNTYSTRSLHWNLITWYSRNIGNDDPNRAAWYSVQFLAPCQSQSEPESMSESHVSVTFIASWIVRSCESALVRAMFIWAVIVRDLVRELVRDYVRAAHVRATPVKATLVRATLFMAKLLSHIVDWLM